MGRIAVAAVHVVGVALVSAASGCINEEADPFGPVGSADVDVAEADKSDESEVLGDYCYAWKNANKGGDSMLIQWQRDYNDLHRAPSFGDTMSSIQCFGGGSGLVLWKNSQWGGSSLTIGANVYVSNLNDYGFDDSVSSLKWVESTGTGGCTVWRDTDYGGPSIFLPASIDWNDFHRYVPASWGDTISSIQCGSLSPWLCRDAPFGNCTSFVAGSDPNLHDNVPSLGDNISSLKWQYF